jgi:hypothetical protein
MIYINKPNERGGTTIFMTMIILSAILVVSLSASSMILNGMKYNKTRYDSTKAFYAAETGAEQIMWEIRKNNRTPIPIDGGDYYNCQDDNTDLSAEYCFNDENDDTIVSCEDDCVSSGLVNNQKLTNESTFKIDFFLDEYGSVGYESLSSTTLTSIGTYKDEVRKIKLTYRSGE